MENWKAVSKVELTYKRALELSKMPKVLNTQDVVNILRDCFNSQTMDLKTSFKVMLLSPVKSVIGILDVSEGHTFAKEKVKLIMQSALLHNADRIIIAHNHPDGDLTIRALDDFITSQTQKACGIVGIELLDSIILTSESYYSFKDNKRLKNN